MPPSNPGTKAARMRELSDLTSARLLEEEARKQVEKLKRHRHDLETKLGSFDSALQNVDALIVRTAHSAGTAARYSVASGVTDSELARSMFIERGEALAERLRKDGFVVTVTAGPGIAHYSDGARSDGTYYCHLDISW